MLKALLETTREAITHIANSIIREGRIWSEWNDSFIINLFRGKGSASTQRNCRGLKLTNHVLKKIKQLMLEQLMLYSSYVNCKKNAWQKEEIYTWFLWILIRCFTAFLCFCYLGDAVTSGEGFTEATTTLCKKFKELLPLLTSKRIFLQNRCKVFRTYIRRALFHTSECWAISVGLVAKMIY